MPRLLMTHVSSLGHGSSHHEWRWIDEFELKVLEQRRVFWGTNESGLRFLVYILGDEVSKAVKSAFPDGGDSNALKLLCGIKDEEHKENYQYALPTVLLRDPNKATKL